MIFYIPSEEEDITFTDFDEAYSYAKENEIPKFRDFQGGEYHV
jgi:hypothetical protein